MAARTLRQWLDMIARTRPDDRAVAALERELARPGSLPDERARPEVMAAIEALRGRAAAAGAGEAPSGRLELEVDYRPHAQGGAGRLFLEVRGRLSTLAGVPYDLSSPGIYLFSDERGFSGLQVDEANSLPERLAAALEELRPLELPPVDLPEAGLANVHVADALEWASREVVEDRRPP